MAIPPPPLLAAEGAAAAVATADRRVDTAWVAARERSAPRPVVYVNGKFTAQETTGVQRVAMQLLLALDGLLAGFGDDWVLVCPPGAKVPPLKHMRVEHLPAPRGSLMLWEQWALMRHARDGLLLNLSGSAPYFGKRQIATLHDAAVFDHPENYTAVFTLWYRRLFRHLARRAQFVLTVSEFSRGRLQERLHPGAERILVLHNGCDHLRRVQADDSVLERFGLQDRRFLLAVGVANRTKNIDALVAAYARLSAAPDQKLVLVGGHNSHVFAGSAPQADPPGVVRTGSVDDASLKALYRHATALVFPSLYEGFGLPALEAMDCGCPVATSHTPAAMEVCGNAALFFDPHSIDDIAAALEKLVGDDLLRARLRAAGRTQSAQFQWSHAAACLLRRMYSLP